MSNQDSLEERAAVETVNKIAEAINDGIASMGEEVMTHQICDALVHLLVENIVAMTDCPHNTQAVFYATTFPAMVKLCELVWADKIAAKEGELLAAEQMGEPEGNA